MITTALLGLLAGIGIFLVACSMMSKNLETISSNGVKNLFAKAAKSRLVGVGIGAVGTAAIQSSGAITVMVIGFVNASIMSLEQAATIIYGANIGTTITGQIVALGFSGGGGISTTVLFSAFAGIGAFIILFGKSEKELKEVTKAQALNHPNWDMGQKVTIDSATMMNKGLEFIEAKWLFDLEPAQIDIVVHRESIVHSMIEFQDNSIIAQMGVPDMRIPIQYALTYPERFESPVSTLSFADYPKLTFYEPDYNTFKCIDICRDAIQKGGVYPAAANGANEAAVKLFLEDKIRFYEIPLVVREAMERAPQASNITLEDIFAADKQAREYVLENIK